MPDGYPGEDDETTPAQPERSRAESSLTRERRRQLERPDRVLTGRTVRDREVRCKIWKVQVTYKQAVSQSFFLNLWLKGQNAFFKGTGLGVQFRTDEFICS